MTHPRPRVRLKLAGQEDALATGRQRRGALLLGAALVTVACFASLFGRAPGPEVMPFIAITATVWSLADILTAFLLLSQFYVTGRALFGFLATAYAFGGYMTWAFIATFPGLFLAGPQTIGDEQVASALWWIWHAAFPALVIFAAVNDSALVRLVSRRAIVVVTGAIALGPFIVAMVLSGLMFAYRDSLPHLVVHGHFEPVYTTFLLPFIIVLNASACGVLLTRRRAPTRLSIWLAVALLSETLDCFIVTFSTARYSYAWDTAKLMTVCAASIVLIMMLRDLVLLYASLGRVARVDALTTLHNRRAFDEHFELVFHNAQRLSGSLGLLIVDIDLFKKYNDAHGHLAGDECLRRVALEIAACAKRPLDMVARYGGEEFVVLLPDTTIEGVRGVADGIRTLVERLEIVPGAACTGVTVSIGIGYAEDVRNVPETALFEIADRALYDAKERGRNVVVLGGATPPAHLATRSRQTTAEAAPGSALELWPLPVESGR